MASLKQVSLIRGQIDRYIQHCVLTVRGRQIFGTFFYLKSELQNGTCLWKCAFFSLRKPLSGFVTIGTLGPFRLRNGFVWSGFLSFYVFVFSKCDFEICCGLAQLLYKNWAWPSSVKGVFTP